MRTFTVALQRLQPHQYVPATLLLVTLVLLAGCGHAHRAPLPVAQLAHSSITKTEFRLNVRYSEQYYTGLGEVSGGSAAFRCTSSQPDTPCSRVERQVLGRLIEEHAVLDYARSHHIQLSLADKIRAEAEAQSLVSLHGGRSWPFSSSRQNTAFFHQLVSRELLIRKVEDVVLPRSLSYGLMLHVRNYLLPIAGTAASPTVYRRAVDLATEGKPIPAGATVRTEWMAPFRLQPAMRQALLDAHPGQYTGPFAHPDTYQVILLLGKAHRRYGKPARDALELSYFHHWLARTVAAERPVCYGNQGRIMACPVQND